MEQHTQHGLFLLRERENKLINSTWRESLDWAELAKKVIFSVKEEKKSVATNLLIGFRREKEAIKRVLNK